MVTILHPPPKAPKRPSPSKIIGKRPEFFPLPVSRLPGLGKII